MSDKPKTKILGIDPAPGKSSTVFDGSEYHRYSPGEVQQLLHGLDPDTLVCWDAPLSGPAYPDAPGYTAGDLTQRPIDRFFSRTEYGYKTPKGISVLPYAGCPHWTISRRILGLPRMGEYDEGWAKLPLALVPVPDEEQQPPRPRVAEVHPAVAMWLWWQKERGDGAHWVYKGAKRRKATFDDLVGRVTAKAEAVGEMVRPVPQNDDQLDALVAYVLGALWIAESGEVELLGDRVVGSLLVPWVAGLAEGFAKMLGDEARRYAARKR